MFEIRKDRSLSEVDRAEAFEAIKAAQNIIPTVVTMVAKKKVNGKALGIDRAAAEVLITLYSITLNGLDEEYGKENVR